MKFSTRTTYGLRAIINLAEHKDKTSVPLSNIAREEDISLKYLERLFANLKKAGLVESVKGAAGGYKLAIEPNKINIYHIINTLEGKTSLFHCLDAGGKVYCGKKCGCKATIGLTKIQESIDSALREIKLNQLL